MEQVFQCPKCSNVDFTKEKEDANEIVVKCKECGTEVVIIKEVPKER